jgi:hypothetical protein
MYSAEEVSEDDQKESFHQNIHFFFFFGWKAITGKGGAGQKLLSSLSKSGACSIWTVC